MLLSMPSDTKIGIIDFIVKIVGGGLTFVLLGVALRLFIFHNSMSWLFLPNYGVHYFQQKLQLRQ
jgi:hypothetical protein